MTKVAPKRGRPSDPHKTEQILEVAGNLFLSKGFHATRMEDIADAACMSKLTLYRRFQDKEALFAAIIRNKCEQYIPNELFDVFDYKSPREAIFIFANALLTLLLSDEPIAMYRMMGSIATTSPELTKLFYKSGPKRIKNLLQDKLNQLNERGILKIDDPIAAQEMLSSMIHGCDIHMLRFLNIEKKSKASDIEKLAELITGHFLKCCNENVL